jgi:hypothetical protein
MNGELSYEVYNDKSFVVRGDRDKYGIILKKCNGRWNPRLKQGAGWIVGKQYENEIKNIIQSLSKTDTDRAKNNPITNEDHSKTSTDTESEVDETIHQQIVKYQDKNSISDEDDTIEPIIKNPKIHRSISASKYNISDSEDNDSEQDTEIVRKSPTEEKILEIIKSEQAKKFELEKKQFEESKKQLENRVNNDDKKRKKERKRERSRDKERKDKERKRDKERKKERKDKERKDKERNRDKERKKERKEEKQRRSPTKETDEDKIKYYKAFSKKPREFKELYPSSNEEINFSCSDSESISSDNSLIPETPKRKNIRKEESYDELFSKVKYLQKKISEIELKNKKQKY